VIPFGWREEFGKFQGLRKAAKTIPLDAERISSFCRFRVELQTTRKVTLLVRVPASTLRLRMDGEKHPATGAAPRTECRTLIQNLSALHKQVDMCPAISGGARQASCPMSYAAIAYLP
jgi:hypothetical protein